MPPLNRSPHTMYAEFVICLVCLAGGAILLLCACGNIRRKRWGRFFALLSGFGLLQLISYKFLGPHMRGYVYQTNYLECSPYECPFKGIPYTRAITVYEGFKATHPDVTMARTFEKILWNPYRWHDYLSHPRWHWPYQPMRSTRIGEQDGAGQPATRPVDESEGGAKPQPEAEGRSR